MAITGMRHYSMCDYSNKKTEFDRMSAEKRRGAVC